MTAKYTWKPALVVGRTTAVIDERGLTLTRGQKVKAVSFADVSAVRFVELIGRTSSTSLVLATRQGKTVLHCGVRLADAAHDANARAFVSACAAVLAALGRARPGLEISHGGGPLLRGFMALLGIALTVIGVGFAILGLAGDGVGEKIIVCLMGGVMAWTGVAMAMSFNPFRPPVRTTAAETASNLAELAGAGS